jgi:hypothetical protein
MSKQEGKFKIEMVTLHQAVNFPAESLAPAGKSTFSYSAQDFYMAPHPLGVKIKKKESDNYGLIVGSANIKQLIFTE